MIEEFEFDYVNEKKVWPIESIAKRKDILGFIVRTGSVLASPLTCHFMRRKSDIASHVSSRFMKIFPSSHNFK